jgi:hypothetical protein
LRDPISGKKKKKSQKRAGGVVQEIECLPSKHKTLSSNPRTKNKQTKTPCAPPFNWSRRVQHIPPPIKVGILILPHEAHYVGRISLPGLLTESDFKQK